MDADWVQVNTEKTRKIYLKSHPNIVVTLHNVTHFKYRDTGCMLKCDEGVVYFERDDISLIISDVDDWIV